MKILMPSRGRAGECSTLNLIPNAIIVCPAKESSEYAKAYPNNDIIEEPSSVNNIVKCRQFILEKFHKEDIFMIDDDVLSVRQNFELKQNTIKSSDIIIEILGNTQHIAKQIGSYLWGYGNLVNPLQYTGLEPIELTGYLNNSYMGFRKNHNLKYNLKMLEGEDHYICLMNKYLNRVHVRDCRYSFLTEKNFAKSGGCQNYRNTSEMIKTTSYLQKLFGSDIVMQKQNTSIKKCTNQGERSLHFPF